MSASAPLVWYHSKADNSARLVLLAISDHDGEGGAWPSIPTLARMTRLSESTVRRSIKALANLGEVEVHLQEGGTARTPEHARPNRYEILLACPMWCDGTARHACRSCAGRGTHKAECGVDDPDAPDYPLSPMTPPVLVNPLSPVTPPPLSLVTPEPPIEPPLTPPTPPAPTVPSPVAALWTGEGISAEEQDALWAEVVADPQTTVPGARARQRAWFVPALARIKAKRSKDVGAALVNVRRFGEPCSHEMPGGAETHPATGLPLCPLCRAKALGS